MITRIIKRTLCASFLTCLSFNASAQDVWINLFQSNGGVYKINADRVSSVDFLNFSLPDGQKIGRKTYTGNRLDFSGDHFYCVYPMINTVDAKVNDGEIVACTHYNNVVYHFYKSAYFRKYDLKTGDAIGSPVSIPTISDVTVLNVGIGMYDTTPCFFMLCKKNSDNSNVVRILNLTTYEQLYEFAASGLSTSSKNVAAFDTSTQKTYCAYLDTKNDRYVIKTYTTTSGTNTTTNYVNLNYHKGIYGTLVDASYYKGHIFFLVGSETEESKLLVYNIRYNNIETIISSGMTAKDVGFFVDNDNSRFVAVTINQEDDTQAYWSDFYINRDKEVTDNNASMNLYTRLTMKNGEIFQTRVKYLSHFTITEGEILKESNKGTYSGNQIDLNPVNSYYTYHFPGILIDNFEDAKAGDYFGGHIYTFFNKGSKDHARVGVFHGYEGTLKHYRTLSCLDNFEICSANFLETMNTYYKTIDGTLQLVTVDIPLVAITGYNTLTGQCESRIISVDNDDIFATYTWEGHTSSNTPSFVSAWDSENSRMWFVGVGEDNNSYKLLAKKISGYNTTNLNTEQTITWRQGEGLSGAIKDCIYSNNMVYLLLEGEGTDANPTRILCADPNVWEITNILPLSSCPNYLDNGTTTMPAVDGIPQIMTLDKKNRRFVIGTQDSSNKGHCWVVTFD